MFSFKQIWSTLIRGMSIKVTLNSLLLIVRIKKSSISGEWLDNKRCFCIIFFLLKKKDVFIENVFYKKNMFLMAESPSPFTIFRVSAKIPRCSHILSLKLCEGNIAVTTLKFIYIARTLERSNYVFKYKKVIMLRLDWKTNRILQNGSLFFICDLLFCLFEKATYLNICFFRHSTC